MTRARRFGGASLVAACIAGRALCAHAEPATAVPAASPAPEPAPTPAATAASAPVTAAPAPAPAAATPKPAGSSLEGFITLAPSVVFGDPANAGYSQSFNRVGLYGEAGVAYRSRYFIDPFLSLGYATLASGVSTLPNGPWGAGGTLDQHLGVWVLSPGVTADLWRFRLRFGIGIAFVQQSMTFLGDTHSVSQTVLANQFGLGFNVLDIHRFRVDAEARLVRGPGADLTFMTFGVVARGDLLCFGKCPE